MAAEENDVVFTEPIYSADYVENRTDRAIRTRRLRHSSTDSTSSGVRKNPSIVAQATRHRTSDGSQRKLSSINGSIAYGDGFNSPKHASGSTHSGTTSLRASVDTQHALTNFAPIAALYMEKETERDARLAKHKPLSHALKIQLKHLREASSSLLGAFLPWHSSKSSNSQLDELKRLAKFHFPCRSEVKNTRDVYRFLQGNHELTKELDRECWEGFEPSFKTQGTGLLDDLRWRNTHLGLAEDWRTLPGYWEACNSDVPWQITEGLSMPNYGPLDGLQPKLWQSDKQALHKHRFFGSAQLVRDVFRCFHRGDGFLLTLSGMQGVNYLDRNFKRHLAEPRGAIFDNDVASAIAFVRQQFSETGTQTWHRSSVEWLLVHLMTEIGATPHFDRQGCNAPTLEGAYQEIRRRQYEHFDRKNPNEPAELIKDMLICEEELRRITVMSKRREQAFELLGIDVNGLELEDLDQNKQPEHENEITATEKVQTALQRANRQTEAFELLLGDICMTLKSVYDLRSIQQRQGGIITEGQHRALVLITLVQLVFIPFTTLYSYWGMNLTDIRQSSWAQHEASSLRLHYPARSSRFCIWHGRNSDRSGGSTQREIACSQVRQTTDWIPRLSNESTTPSILCRLSP
ncbi:MAG: hypothetical protein Q9209_006643 [Squamulea sp. 1 TL-2023]